MARPKIGEKRKGGRNAQYFKGLEGLGRAINAVIDSSEPVTLLGVPRKSEERYAAAEAKRQRRMQKRKPQ